MIFGSMCLLFSFLAFTIIATLLQTILNFSFKTLHIIQGFNVENGQRETLIRPPLIENRYLIEGKNVARQKTHNSLLIAMLSR